MVNQTGNYGNILKRVYFTLEILSQMLQNIILTFTWMSNDFILKM